MIRIMLYEKLDELIKESMKAHNDLRTKVLRLIKSQITNAMTAKGAGELNEAKEIQILAKMVKIREESAKEYRSANRSDLAEIEEAEIEIIKEFLPKEATEEEVINTIEEVIGVHGNNKAVMGAIIKSVKSKYPSFDGGRLAAMVKERLV